MFPDALKLTHTKAQVYSREPEGRGAIYRNLGHLLEGAEAVLDQPADPEQASQRPPCADQLDVDLGAVAGENVVQVLLVCQRQGGKVEERVALGRLGPVDDAGDLVTVDEDVADLQVAVG